VPAHPKHLSQPGSGRGPRARRRLYPQLAQVALQTGRHAGQQIRALAVGQPTTPFPYRDKGMMAIIGRNAAIVQAGWLRLTGRLAWITWGFLHLTYLPGAEKDPGRDLPGSFS
jgi:NADH dehydrogenase FAD-containing subunit